MEVLNETIKKRDIRKLSFDELKAFMIEHGDKAFRAKQIYEWIWKKSVTSIDQMTNLSLETRTFLDENFVIKPVTVSEKQVSKPEISKDTVETKVIVIKKQIIKKDTIYVQK